MSGFVMEKEDIRKMLLDRRNDFSKEEVVERSRIIKRKLLKLPEFREAKKIMIYLHFGNEVKTSGIIKECILQGKEVFIPINDFEKNEFYISKFPGYDNLERDKFGIPSPKKELIKAEDPSKLDMIIAPGVAFDLEGNRIGFGRGFFDKFISSLEEKVLVIGLCFDFQLLDSIPADKNDIPMNEIITEKRLISL